MKHKINIIQFLRLSPIFFDLTNYNFEEMILLVVSPFDWRISGDYRCEKAITFPIQVLHLKWDRDATARIVELPQTIQILFQKSVVIHRHRWMVNRGWKVSSQSTRNCLQLCIANYHAKGRQEIVTIWRMFLLFVLNPLVPPCSFACLHVLQYKCLWKCIMPL